MSWQCWQRSDNIFRPLLFEHEFYSLLRWRGYTVRDSCDASKEHQYMNMTIVHDMTVYSALVFRHKNQLLAASSRYGSVRRNGNRLNRITKVRFGFVSFGTAPRSCFINICSWDLTFQRTQREDFTSSVLRANFVPSEFPILLCMLLFQTSFGCG